MLPYNVKNPNRHSGRPTTVREKMGLFKKCAMRCNFPSKFNATERHPSESWDPVPLTLCKSLDPSFRWDDEPFSHFCKTCRHFPRTAMGLRWNDDEV